MRKNFLWQVANALSIALINILFVMIMARYIPKEVHGVYAILLVLNNFFFMFSQFGLGAALIQKEEIDKKDINNAFFLNLFIGLLLYILLFFLSGTLSNFFDGKIGIVDIRLLGITLIVSSFSSISLSLLQRDFKFKTIFIINAISYAIGYLGIGVFLAIKGFEIKAFVYAQIVLQILLSIIAYKFVSFKIRSQLFSLKASRFFIKFGKEFTLIRLLSLVSGKIDKLILGKTIALNILANFEKAQYLTFLPPRFLNNLTNGFLFSLFSRIQNDNKKLFSLYASITGLIMLAVLHVSFFMFFVTTLVVELFYGKNWLDINVLVEYFAFAAPFITLTALSDALVRSKNRFIYSIWAKVGFTIGIIVTSLMSLYFPIEKIIIFQIVITIVYAIVMNQICLKILENSFLNFLKSYKGFVISILIFLGFYFILIRFSFNENLIIILSFELVIIVATIIFRTKLFTVEQMQIINKLLRR